MQRRTKNLLKFFFTKLFPGVAAVLAALYYSRERDPLRIVGFVCVLALAFRILKFLRKTLLMPTKDVVRMGKWAIVTGSTSGIGQAFAEELAMRGMSVLCISRTQSKLEAQCAKLVKDSAEKAGKTIEADYLAFDFSQVDGNAEFYSSLRDKCQELQQDGGIGCLVNNVGTANEDPMFLEEMDEDFVTDIININCFSTVFMTRTVIPFMKERHQGAVISVSSGSGTHPTGLLSLYSATKSFMIQFSRSMTFECENDGLDFVVIHPYYVVSNLFKGKAEMLVPMPQPVVQQALAMVGRDYIGYGYWAHALIGIVAGMHWDTPRQIIGVMHRNRKRALERKKKREAADSAASSSNGSS